MLELASGNLVVIEASGAAEQSSGHVVLQDVGHGDYVIGECTSFCPHLPMGVYHLDAEAETLTSDGETLKILHVFDGHHPSVVLRYGAYVLLVEMAAPYEAKESDYKEVCEKYPEVLDLLENLALDPLGLVDPTALYKAATILINENIVDPRQRDIMMGCFLDIYAEEFGSQEYVIVELPEE